MSQHEDFEDGDVELKDGYTDYQGRLELNEADTRLELSDSNDNKVHQLALQCNQIVAKWVVKGKMDDEWEIVQQNLTEILRITN